MASARVRLFVYGSLKRGGRHHDELVTAGATFLGEAVTVPGYRLEALDATEEYVALVPDAPDAPAVVHGELFEVPESRLPALDAFEGEAYTRGLLKLQRRGRGGDAVEADSLAYFKKAR